MFQFSTLLSRPDAGTSRRRPSAADPEPVSSSIQTNVEDSPMSAARQCVSERVRRDLDDQMHRLAELLDRVESHEFEREAEAADIFSLGKTDWPEEPAEQPRIFEDTESAPETDGGFPASDLTVDWEFDVYADEGATGDESAASSIVVPAVIPLSTREIECLTAPSVICNSPGTAALEPGLFTPLANPRRSVEHKPDAQARDEYQIDAPARGEFKPDAQARETERQPLACGSGVCSGVNNPNDEKPRSKPIATDTRPTRSPAQNDKAQAPTLPCTRKHAFERREVERAVLPKTPADAPLTSGVVQNYCLTPPRASLESTPALETSEPPGCLTPAAPNFEESLGLQRGPFDYPLASELTGRLETGTDETNSSADADRSSSHTPDANDFSEPREDYSHAVETSADLSAPRSDALIQAYDNSLCNTPASAAAFPSRFASLDFASRPFDPAAVHMLVVNDIAACPAPSPIQASACSHSHSPARQAHTAATEYDSPIDLPRRSLRRTLSIESPPAGDSFSATPSRSGGPQILNILAVIGCLLTFAALAYVASDLASWFGAP